MTKEQLMEPRVQLYAAPIRNKTVKCEASVLDVYNYITHTSLSPQMAQLVRSGVRLSGPAQGIVEATETLRTITDPKLARDYKANHFSYALPSGLFGERTDQGLLRHSSLICLDFDHLGDGLYEIRQRLIDDPYFETELLFTSPTGDGLKWWVEVDLARADHRTWFNAIRRYVAEAYGVQLDETCVNPSRACFLPYDKECYVNPEGWK